MSGPGLLPIHTEHLFRSLYWVYVWQPLNPRKTCREMSEPNNIRRLQFGEIRLPTGQLWIRDEGAHLLLIERWTFTDSVASFQLRLPVKMLTEFQQNHPELFQISIAQLQTWGYHNLVCAAERARPSIGTWNGRSCLRLQAVRWGPATLLPLPEEIFCIDIQKSAYSNSKRGRLVPGFVATDLLGPYASTFTGGAFTARPDHVLHFHRVARVTPVKTTNDRENNLRPHQLQPSVSDLGVRSLGTSLSQALTSGQEMFSARPLVNNAAVSRGSARPRNSAFNRRTFLSQSSFPLSSGNSSMDIEALAGAQRREQSRPLKRPPQPVPGASAAQAPASSWHGQPTRAIVRDLTRRRLLLATDASHSTSTGSSTFSDPDLHEVKGKATLDVADSLQPAINYIANDMKRAPRDSYSINSISATGMDSCASGISERSTQPISIYRMEGGKRKIEQTTSYDDIADLIYVYKKQKSE